MVVGEHSVLPEVLAQLRTDRSATVVFNGSSFDLQGQDLTDTRAQALHYITGLAAQIVGGPVQVALTDPDGTGWRLVVTPEGDVTEEAPADGGSSMAQASSPTPGADQPYQSAPTAQSAEDAISQPPAGGQNPPAPAAAPDPLAFAPPVTSVPSAPAPADQHAQMPPAPLPQTGEAGITTQQPSAAGLPHPPAPVSGSSGQGAYPSDIAPGSVAHAFRGSEPGPAPADEGSAAPQAPQEQWQPQHDGLPTPHDSGRFDEGPGVPPAPGYAAHGAPAPEQPYGAPAPEQPYSAPAPEQPYPHFAPDGAHTYPAQGAPHARPAQGASHAHPAQDHPHPGYAHQGVSVDAGHPPPQPQHAHPGPPVEAGEPPAPGQPGIPPAGAVPEGQVPRRRDLRESFLRTEQAEAPAQQGLRGALGKIGIRTSPSAAERAERADINAVSQHWPGVRTIAVVNGKGGANKTPTTALLAAVFARHSGSATLAWDNNETRGTLGWRTEQGKHEATVQDLLPQGESLLDPSAKAGDISHFVHHQAADKYDVLRSNPNVLSAEQRLTGDDVDLVHDVAGRYYRLIFIDSGNDESADHWLRMIDKADQLVVATIAKPEHAEAGALLLEALGQRDEHGAQLAQRAVVVVSQAREKDANPSAQQIADGFTGWVREVVTIPYDRAMVESVLHFDSLNPATQRAWLRAGAAVAGGL